MFHVSMQVAKSVMKKCICAVTRFVQTYIVDHLKRVIGVFSGDVQSHCNSKRLGVRCRRAQWTIVSNSYYLSSYARTVPISTTTSGNFSLFEHVVRCPTIRVDQCGDVRSASARELQPAKESDRRGAKNHAA